MSIKGSWYHGPEHLCCKTPKSTDANYHTDNYGPEHLCYQRVVDAWTMFVIMSWHVGTYHASRTFSGREVLDRRYEFSGRMLPPLHHHHKNARNTTTKTPKTPPQSCKTATSTSSRAGCCHSTTKTPETPPQKHQKHHHNLAKQRQVRVLGPDVDTAKKKYEFSGHNTTTKTPPHQHKNTTTPLQEHHHKNITTKNTTTKTSPHNHKNTSMCEQHVCARCLDTLYVNTLCEHEDRKVRKLPRKMNISSWAGCGRTPKSRRITMQTRLQFLGRMLQPQKRQKSPSFIVKAPVKSIGEHRKVRELPRKMNIEEVEEA